jgi:hypothetical protein
MCCVLSYFRISTLLIVGPGGIRQQFKAAVPLVEQILKEVKAMDGFGGKMDARILDQGDAVGLWENEAFGAVIFPTAESLGEVIQASERGNKSGGKELFLLINPQWTMKGQLISDFGILPWQKAKNEKFVGEFQPSYVLRQTRIQGEDIRVLRIYPGPYQVRKGNSNSHL